MLLFKKHHKSATAIIIFTLSLVIAATRFTYPTLNTNYRTSLLEQIENAEDFDTFTTSLFCYEVTSDSVTTAYTLKNPDTYNIPTLTPTLTSFSGQETNQTKEESLYTIINNGLSHFDPDCISSSDQITYELLHKTLALNSELNKYSFYQELLGASTGVQGNLSVTLGEYPLYDEEDIKTYLSLLKQVPDYFENIIKYEKKKTELNLSKKEIIYPDSIKSLKTILEGINGTDNSFIQTFDQRVDQISSLTKKQKNDYKKKNQRYVKKYILPAYNSLYEYLTNNASADSTASTIQKHTAYGLSSFPEGKEYYSLLVKQSTGSTKSVEELISLTENQLSSALDNVLNTALENPGLYTYYLENEPPACCNTPENTLYTLSLLTRKDYPLLSKTPEYSVKNVSESLASSLSPAFYMIPAIDNDTANTIYINPLYTNEENGNLFTTLAHEGFPGHLYQTLYFNETNPNPLRQILNYPGYVEGWATYVEIQSYKYLDYPNNKENLCELYQGDTIISLAISSRIDMGVNYENWTLQDVENFFEAYGFKSYYAKDLYSYVVEAPSNYLSYFIGYLEIMELKKEYQNIMGENYTEKDFHKHLLDLGPCDFDTAKQYILSPKS